MAREGSKRSQAIAIMNANADKAMDEVVALIASEIEVTEANARSYYTWIVKNGKAAGLIVARPRGRKASAPKARALKAKPAKTKKAAATRLAKAKVAVEGKTEAEVAEIKAKNLARLKEVGARMNAQRATDTVEDTDVPAVLTAAEVAELV